MSKIGRRSVGALVAAASLVALVSSPADARAGHGRPGGRPPAEPVTVLAEGLNAPFGLDATSRAVYVAESDAGQVLKIDRRGARPVVTGLFSPTAVAATHHGLYVVTGGAEVPDASLTGDSTVYLVGRHGSKRVVADLEAYELANNPDGQLQFDPETGAPLDALSNPFAMLERHGRHGGVFVADAGANAVLTVSKHGTVRTFFVPPVVTTGGCAGLPNNDPEHTGCDPVPTGLAYGPGGTLYVSTLSAEVPGEGRVYVLDAHTGAVRKVIGDLDAPTGLAVAPDGTVFVSEVLFNAPAGPPPPGFDPAAVGRIVRIDRAGRRTTAAVTMPTGLDYRKGVLYASAWSIAGFLGIPDAGQVVAVRPSAFG